MSFLRCLIITGSIFLSVNVEATANNPSPSVKELGEEIDLILKKPGLDEGRVSKIKNLLNQIENPSLLFKRINTALLFSKPSEKLKSMLWSFAHEISEEFRCDIIEAIYEEAFNNLKAGNNLALQRAILGKEFPHFLSLGDSVQEKCKIPINFELDVSDEEILAACPGAENVISPIECPAGWIELRQFLSDDSIVFGCKKDVNFGDLLPQEVQATIAKNCTPGSVDVRYPPGRTWFNCKFKESGFTGNLCGSWRPGLPSWGFVQPGYFACEKSETLLSMDMKLRSGNLPLQMGVEFTKLATETEEVFRAGGLEIENCKKRHPSNQWFQHFIPDLEVALQSFKEETQGNTQTSAYFDDGFRLKKDNDIFYVAVKASESCNWMVQNLLRRQFLRVTKGSATSFVIQSDGCPARLYWFREILEFHRFTKHQFPKIQESVILQY